MKQNDLKSHIRHAHEEFGVRIGGDTICNLGYADDLAIMEESTKKLQFFLDIFNKNSNEVGLKMNTKKTKSMVITKISPSASQFYINNEKNEEISEFKYFGYVISKDGSDKKAINGRSRLGWAAFNHKKPILKNNTISRNVKKRVVETYIYPVISYGLDASFRTHKKFWF